MSATPASPAATIAANRFGLGARPGELDRLGAPDAWLLRQIEGSPVALEGEGLEPSAAILARALALRDEAREQRRKARENAASDASAANAAAAAAALARLPAIYRPVYANEIHARFTHAVTTDRPFLERLTQFWSNHFAVSVDKVVVLGLAGAMEREAIRPHVTGRFADMLLAVEKHPAMLLYLDNATSIGPNSRAARLIHRRGAGRKADINENLAREILELHTLGVDGGYTQTDVTTFAYAISGWSIGGNEYGRRGGARQSDGGRPGEFHFRAAFHEPGAKRLLGRKFDDDGVGQGEAILRDLAMRPATARHVCTRLARHFIADDPPTAVVDRMVRAWRDSGANLPAVYAAMIRSPESWKTPLAKFKSPADFIYSTYRGLGIPIRDRRRALQPFEALGQRSLSPGSPAGWPDTSAGWDGSSALLKRIAWADAVAQRLTPRDARRERVRDARELAPQLLGATLSDDTAKAIARAETGAQALTLLLVSPEFMRR